MLKQALYTYWKQLRHPKILKDIRNYTIIMLFFLWFVLPYIMKIETKGEMTGYIASLALPIFMVELLRQISQNDVPKAMFLVPMNKSDRKNYIKYLLCIKIGVPVLLGVGIDFLWRLRYGGSMINLGFTAILYFSYAVSEYICLHYTYPTGDTIWHGVRTRDGSIIYSLPNLINKCAVWLIVFGITSASENSLFLGEAVGGYVLLLRISFLLMVILDVFILLRQTVSVLEEHCEYKYM